MKSVFALALLVWPSVYGYIAQEESFDEIAKRAAEALSTNPAEAAKLYSQATALKPSWAEGWFYLGASNYEIGRFAQSRSAFQKAAELAPERGTVWAFLGLSELRLAQTRDALADIRKGETLGLANDPKFVATIRKEASLACIRTADFACAVEQLLPLARQGYDPENIMPILGVAVLGIPSPPADLAAAKREEVRLAGETAWNLYGQRGDAANALSLELVKKYPNEHGVHYLRGICLVHSDPATARHEFQNEMRLSPVYAPARLQVAMLDMEAGNPNSALTLSRAAVKLQPDSALGHVILGRSLLSLKQTPQAVSELEASVTLAPNNPQTHFFLEQAYRQAGRTADANEQKQEFNRLKSTFDPVVLDYSQTTLSDSPPAATKAPR